MPMAQCIGSSEIGAYIFLSGTVGQAFQFSATPLLKTRQSGTVKYGSGRMLEWRYRPISTQYHEKNSSAENVLPT